jgi:tRNA nucleotidyltransferase/poly(A) polymerase
MENNKKVRVEIRKILSESFLTEGEIRLKFDIPLPKDIYKIKDVIKNAGYKLYVVGGAVRDALLGKTPKDFDLATDALPDTIQNLLKPFYKTLETGKSFGVINVITPSGEYEIATFRLDRYEAKPDFEEFKDYLKQTNPAKYQEFIKMIMK